MKDVKENSSVWEQVVVNSLEQECKILEGISRYGNVIEAYSTCAAFVAVWLCNV